MAPRAELRPRRRSRPADSSSLESRPEQLGTALEAEESGLCTPLRHLDSHKVGPATPAYVKTPWFYVPAERCSSSSPALSPQAFQRAAQRARDKYLRFSQQHKEGSRCSDSTGLSKTHPQDPTIVLTESRWP